ncbi:hypothetical protein [Candidatus Synchoanobacter obligatus]|uniref:Uncharacterized protein n=1 Tax=Candidatus Synchoanobacter obligatus TaxID=2919597 RepID=A0ABT1L4Q1_9GAMM|nr:hypothetical protein [Candidatus Synchoanobacter obligatus]MCP8352136.1 hypothetical protein [Candidatus Synchoanobacter obligatus]
MNKILLKSFIFSCIAAWVVANDTPIINILNMSDQDIQVKIAPNCTEVLTQEPIHITKHTLQKDVSLPEDSAKVCLLAQSSTNHEEKWKMLEIMLPTKKWVIVNEKTDEILLSTGEFTTHDN